MQVAVDACHGDGVAVDEAVMQHAVLRDDVVAGIVIAGAARPIVVGHAGDGIFMVGRGVHDRGPRDYAGDQGSGDGKGKFLASAALVDALGFFACVLEYGFLPKRGQLRLPFDTTRCRPQGPLLLYAGHLFPQNPKAMATMAKPDSGPSPNRAIQNNMVISRAEA
ncbi:MAG TPA: hypothetical protein VFH12_06725 [Pseudoxanthomonas sp.]|nr:hypothetical protein [Pseudoxanthomonas sp.]